jgi:hypothetical protein
LARTNSITSFIGSMGTYKATVYDKATHQSRKKKEVQIDIVVRDLYVSQLAMRGLFQVTSDFETMAGFRVFEKML